MSYKVNREIPCNNCECGEEINSEDTMCRECWDESPERIEFLNEMNDEFYFPIEDEE